MQLDEATVTAAEAFSSVELEDQIENAGDFVGVEGSPQALEMKESQELAYTVYKRLLETAAEFVPELEHTEDEYQTTGKLLGAAYQEELSRMAGSDKAKTLALTYVGINLTGKLAKVYLNDNGGRNEANSRNVSERQSEANGTPNGTIPGGGNGSPSGRPSVE